MPIFAQTPPARTRIAGGGAPRKFTAEDKAAMEQQPGVLFRIEGYAGTSVPKYLKELPGFKFVSRQVGPEERAIFGRYDNEETAQVEPETEADEDEDVAEGVDVNDLAPYGYENDTPPNF